MSCDTLATESLASPAAFAGNTTLAGVEQAQIRVQDDRDDGADATAIEGIALCHQDGTAIPRLGAVGVAEGRPTGAKVPNQTYADVPDLFYHLRVARIRKISVPDKFVSRHERGRSLPRPRRGR
jgi:hypothetical protein